jgi:hypothetical protein
VKPILSVVPGGGEAKIEYAADGIIRCRPNFPVHYLLDNDGLDLNDLARPPNVPDEDLMQLAQPKASGGTYARTTVGEPTLKRFGEVAGALDRRLSEAFD